MHPQIAVAVDSVAQQVEHHTFNVGVLGSSPSRVTTIATNLLKIKLVAFFMHDTCTTY